MEAVEQESEAKLEEEMPEVPPPEELRPEDLGSGTGNDMELGPAQMNEEVSDADQMKRDEDMEAAQMMQDFDKDKDGKVTLKEFTADHEQEAYFNDRAQEIASVFAKNDKDKDNKLDKQEMRSADQEMQKLGM